MKILRKLGKTIIDLDERELDTLGFALAELSNKRPITEFPDHVLNRLLPMIKTICQDTKYHYWDGQ